MPTSALKDLLRRAKVTFINRDKKPDLIERALQSPRAMAIVEEEAKAEGEHIDGAKFEVQTVEGSFVNIDNSMLVRGLPPTDAEHTPVRRSTLATNMRLSILTMVSLDFASHITGNLSVRSPANVVSSCLILCEAERGVLTLQTRHLIQQWS
jgi:hypothetical protein